MDLIKFFGDGFPLTIERLQFLQNTYTKAIAQLSKIAGSGNLIIDGAIPSGGNISAGVLIIDGEVIAFEAGTFNARVAIFETVTQVPYNIDADSNGSLDLKDSDVVRVARCAASGGVESFDFSTLQRVANLQAVAPQVGDLKLIYRAFDPVTDIGWALCNGSNGTPDFRDKFPIMAGGAHDVGDEGGEETVALSKANMPSYTMTGNTNTTGAHTHSTNGRAPVNQSVDNGGGSVVQDNNSTTATINSAGNHSHSVSISTGGSNTPHENRPPFKAANMLIYVGV